MTARGISLLAAVIAGAALLLVLRVIGLLIKIALVIALVFTLLAWPVFAAIGRRFSRPR